jgi:hypothetical protein
LAQTAQEARSMMALGAVSPEVDGQMVGLLQNLYALNEQISNDIVLLGRQGASAAVIDSLQTRNGAFESAILLLQTDRVVIEDDASAGAWLDRAAQVGRTGADLVDATVKARGSAVERQRFMGLGWGLGSAVIVGGLGWLVWRQRGKRRRRR